MHDRFIKCAALAAAMSATLVAPAVHATSEVWDQNWTPLTGFGGLTRTWSLDAPGSAYAAWNVFNPGSPAVIYDATPDAGSYGVAHAFVYETGLAGAFVTGGGNIYSFSGTTDFQSYIQGSDMSGAGVRDVALRLETLGSALDPASVKLDGASPASQQRFDTAFGGSFGGTETEWVFVWTNVPNAGPLQFTFGAAASSMSLAQAAMYYSPAAAVPEPYEWALMLAGLCMVRIAARARRAAGTMIG